MRNLSMEPERPGSATGRAAPADPSAPERAPDASWAELGSLAAACTACPLHRSRQRVVLFRGARHPKVLFIGEAPGAEEDRAGVPFVGRAGRELDAAARAVGLPEDEWAVLNLIKCRPPENRFPPASARRCRPFLDRQIALLEPRWVVTLGRHALQALEPTAPPISEVSGTLRRWQGRWLVPLLHPAASLHDPRRRARWSSDLDRLRSALLAPPETL